MRKVASKPRRSHLLLLFMAQPWASSGWVLLTLFTTTEAKLSSRNLVRVLDKMDKSRRSFAVGCWFKSSTL